MNWNVGTVFSEFLRQSEIFSIFVFVLRFFCSGYWILSFGFSTWTLDFVFWVFYMDTGFCLLDFLHGYWILSFGFSPLNIGFCALDFFFHP